MEAQPKPLEPNSYGKSTLHHNSIQVNALPGNRNLSSLDGHTKMAEDRQAAQLFLSNLFLID